jgi:hypothetical protein
MFVFMTQLCELLHRKVPLQVNFLDDDIFHCLLRVLSFYMLYDHARLQGFFEAGFLFTLPNSLGFLEVV